MRPITLILLAACSHKGDTVDTGTADNGPGPDLTLSLDPTAGCALAADAVAVAPDWVQDDLAIALASVKSENCDELSALLLDLDEPWLTDEVAFTIAHLGQPVIDGHNFYPQLVLENAQLVYARDEDLPYVSLVDVGEPGVDPDYYTTATYLVDDDDGTRVERSIDPEVYYWYVVHPRMEDELPYYIDGWDSCGSQECAASPEDGMLWREFLWEGAAEECPADRDCPLLEDYLSDQEVLWASKAGESEGNGAIGQIIEWEQAAMTFGAGDERPIQPNRIYAVGAGNCGEWADLATSAARTGLIPAHNVGARSNDHTWNEFWDEGWNEFEPVNTYVEHYTYYVDENGDYGRTLDYLDNDCDGTADEGADNEDHDSDGYSIADGDCDDTRADVNPGMTETDTDLYDDDCDGVAADPGSADDADGDGVTVADGDCDDTSAEISPDLAEVDGNGVDDDCDGVTDDGTDTSDADGDGVTIADGDCNDNDADVFPGNGELPDNGLDDDCSGLADVDMDGDGYTIADGDCDDVEPSVYPGADDPAISRNRLFVITDSRGDSLIGTARTEAYGTEAFLAVSVTDHDGHPVDGAVVTIYGNWSVYGYPEYPAWAAEAVTDPNGEVLVHVGEANPYGFSVDSPVGTDPDPGYYYGDVVDWAEPGETYTIDSQVDGTLPARPEATEVAVEGGSTTLSAHLQIDSAKVEGDGIYTGLSSQNYEGQGHLDLFVVDEDGYAAFTAGEPFEGVTVATDLEDGASTDTQLTEDRDWFLVIANTDYAATTVVGDLEATATGPGGQASLSVPLRIPPQTHLALTLSPAE